MSVSIRKMAVAIVCSVISATAFASTPDCPTCDSWAPAYPGNYTDSSRPASYLIQYIIIHKVQGSASSAVSWWQNPAANESYHYAFRYDGYAYQCVRDADIAWCSGNWTMNTKSIGLAHTAWNPANPGTGPTTACYDASAVEASSCIIYYDVTLDRIIGRDEVPGSTTPDPGPTWDWVYYMAKIRSLVSVSKCLVDDSPSFITNGTRQWVYGTSLPGHYGPGYYSHITGAFNAPATWTVNIPVTGNYTISAIWPSGPNLSSSAPFILPDGSVVHKNQQANGGQWNLLGTKYLTAGPQSVKLSCWAPSGYTVIADAVAFCPQ